MAVIPTISSQPPSTAAFIITYPAPGVLLVTINKLKARNSISLSQHWEADAFFQWFDEEPSLTIGIITGVGEAAFCAGQDLKEQAAPEQGRFLRQVGLPAAGFAGLSKRVGKKPVIAAVNGLAIGGGFEICLNCDIVIAAPRAGFALPEALRGLYAGAGGLPRLVRTCGLQIASEMALTGRIMPAAEAKHWGLVNRISSSNESLLEEAVKMARAIQKSSPDAVVVTRAGLREAWENASVERATQLTAMRYQNALLKGENAAIGLRSFATKQEPSWVSPKI